jgi:hypothetical protein
MDVNTGNEDESSSQDTPEEAKEESQPAAAAPAPAPIVADKVPEPAAEEPKQLPVVLETSTVTPEAVKEVDTADPIVKEAVVSEEEPLAKRPKVDGGED